MRYKPLENPNKLGCMNCSVIPSKTLDRDEIIHIYGMVSIYFNTDIENQYDNYE